MKLLALFTILFWGLLDTAIAQPSPSEKQYVENGNFLVNPSFEQGKKGWTLVEGSWTTTSTGANVAHIIRAAEITLATETLDFSQSVGLNQALAGRNVVVSARVKTTVTDLQICGVVNGTDVGCREVDSSGDYVEYSIRTAFGNTSNGIRVKSLVDKIGVVHVDDAKILLEEFDPQIQHGNLIPNASFERDDLTGVSCTNATASFESSELGGQGNQRQLTITSTDTDWSCDIVGAASEGQGVLKLATRATVTGSEYCALINSTEQLCKDIAVTGTMYTDVIYPTLGGTANSLRIKGATSGDVVKVDMVELQQQALGSVSVDSNPVNYTPTFQGAGTVSGVNIKWARQGAFLVLDGYFTAGTVTADQARIGLPLGLVVDTGYAALTVFGNHNVDFDTGIYLRTLMGVSGQSYLTFGGNLTPTSSLSSRNGNVIFITGARVSVKARVPIQGWLSNTAAVTGPCIGFECVNDFKVRLNGSTCAIVAGSETPSGWITSTSVAGTGQCTINVSGLGLTNIPLIKHSVEWSGGYQSGGSVINASATSFDVVNATTSTGVVINPLFHHVEISKLGVDNKQQLEVKGVVSKDFVSGGVEVYTGDKWDGAEIYRRCYEVASDITSATTIATIDTGLELIQAIEYFTDFVNILSHDGGGSSASRVQILYRPSTGVISAVGEGTFVVKAGTKFCLKYLK